MASKGSASGGSMPGGWSELNLDDPEVRKDVENVTSKAMSQVNEQSNDSSYLMSVRVLSAKSHVVAGVEYELRVLVGQSTCKKAEVQAAGDGSQPNCSEEKEGSKRKVYTLRVWEKSWENFIQTTIAGVEDATGTE